MTYECVDGPWAGRTISIPDNAHDSIVYEPVSLAQGTVRYELRKDQDGHRRLYYVIEEKE